MLHYLLHTIYIYNVNYVLYMLYLYTYMLYFITLYIFHIYIYEILCLALPHFWQRPSMHKIASKPITFKKHILLSLIKYINYR